MGYTRALEKAWSELGELTAAVNLSVKFLADEYTVDINGRKISSVSCNVPAKDHYAIVILHYIIKKMQLKYIPPPLVELIDFRQLEGGEGYYAAFKKRTIDVILRKYGEKPEMLVGSGERLGGRASDIGDFSITVEVFEHIPVVIALWKGDEEFGPEANILFDRNISGVFCTEDIVVITEVVARSL